MSELRLVERGRIAGAHAAALARDSKIDVLVLDDFLAALMTDSENRDLLV